MLSFDAGKALAFSATLRWKELFLHRVEGRAAEATRNYFHAGSKVEPAGRRELFSCRVEGRAPEPENYRSTLWFILESKAPTSIRALTTVTQRRREPEFPIVVMPSICHIFR